ncbi:META domain-containing protein [Rhodococcus kronopolitis]|uniref:META domain-containing protein n=1 Tax=Rhodococcus kronopolitis TaxID=1460226 RepID=A0ABV9FK71_9NOCA
MQPSRLIGLALLAAATLTACSTSAEASDESANSDLVGRTFVSTSVEGTAIPGGGPLTVTFPEADRIALHAGCNRASGTADLSGGVITTGPLATTMMACVGDAGMSDQWMTGFFAASPQWTLDGDALELRNGEATVSMLDKKVAQPDRPLTDTVWVVDTLITPSAVTTSRALETSQPSLQIGADGAVTGFTGCNRMTGTAEVAGETVTFGPLGVTRMACTEETAEIEQAVLAALSGETTATVDADRLRIMNAEGHGLGLRAQ